MKALEAMTINEISRFNELKKVIKKGFDEYLDVGFALLEISKSKLYREDYTTFEEFCQEEFKIPRRQAYKMIEAASVVQSVPNLAHSTKPSQLAEIAKIDPQKREAVIEKASKSGKLTAKSIKKAAKEETPVATDKTGYAIPAAIEEAWKLAEEYGSHLCSLISEVRSSLKAEFDKENQMLAEVNNSVLADLNNAYTTIKRIVPHAVCTSCQGRAKKCDLCKGRGYISKFAYDSFVPEETKKIREGK